MGICGSLGWAVRVGYTGCISHGRFAIGLQGCAGTCEGTLWAAGKVRQGEKLALQARPSPEQEE